MNGHGRRRPRRHCMVVFAHYPGDETRVQRQAEALLDRGFEVDILCLRATDGRREASEEIVNGAHVHRLSLTRSYGNVSLIKQFWEYLAFLWLAMIALVRLHPRRRYSVVQVHNLPDFLVFAAWLPKLLGARIVLDLHDLMPEFLAARTGRSLGNWLVRLVALQERLSCRFADHVIAVTELWRETLIRRGVPSSKVSVVMNVADDRIFRRNGRRGLAKDGESLHLFYHGVVAPRSGIDLVIEAIACLHEELPGIRFTIHSRGGPYLDLLVERSKQLAVADHVRVSSDLRPVSELPKLIGAADVGLVPYRRDVFTDGILPTKLMEYTALGVPSIAARTRAIEAYFDDSMVEFFTAGDVEDLAAAIRRLARDRGRLEMLSQQSDNFNRRHNWTVQGASYVALIERLGQS